RYSLIAALLAPVRLVFCLWRRHGFAAVFFPRWSAQALAASDENHRAAHRLFLRLRSIARAISGPQHLRLDGHGSSGSNDDHRHHRVIPKADEYLAASKSREPAARLPQQLNTAQYRATRSPHPEIAHGNTASIYAENHVPNAAQPTIKTQASHLRKYVSAPHAHGIKSTAACNSNRGRERIMPADTIMFAESARLNSQVAISTRRHAMISAKGTPRITKVLSR